MTRLRCDHGKSNFWVVGDVHPEVGGRAHHTTCVVCLLLCQRKLPFSSSSHGLATARVTPRIESDGTVLLRVETERKGKTVQATGKVADGGTLVMRVKSAGKRETLVIVTINRVVSEQPIECH